MTNIVDFGEGFKTPKTVNPSQLGSINNLSRGWAMMISLFFPFIFWNPLDHLRVFYSNIPSRDVDLSK